MTGIDGSLSAASPPLNASESAVILKMIEISGRQFAANGPVVFLDIDVSGRSSGDVIVLNPNIENFSLARDVQNADIPLTSQ